MAAPSSPSARASAGSRAAPVITGLHHVGHVVRDIAAATAVYRRLGFALPPAAFPALPADDGGPPRALGAGNTRAVFARGFVELATVLGPGDTAGEGVHLHPLAVPPEARARLTESAGRTTERLRAALGRFEGLHILAFHTPDADAAAARLTAEGIGHSGVHRLRRPAASGEGGRPVEVGYLELDDAPGRTPEGRLAVAEAAPTGTAEGAERGEGAAGPAHPNGAVALVESVLCVPDGELHRYADRYAAYLGRTARGEGGVRAFDLGASRLVLATPAGLDSIVPGHRRGGAPPFFAAYGVEVGDLGAATAHLRRNAVPFREARGGAEVHVPAAFALGAAVVLRQEAASAGGGPV
ncbi:VOC family protein [Streptomonospora nanhaiensis]|uniref:Catechol 2,3-dioxygenase-like lactoylglutathione lyase family enzyme n=1 Tax=Streptomonospora nanhaiensis TaxID=1323731 RepID=A0A853BJE7_9ACTN|nr:VOC family protein [Streptomonospora nanhaiensis]MBV2364196.1 VOC family protein [Streptomonospora nanhaiensis]MBX9386684.1 VOC family protein [Streptomonospora nanhaiensis]NYI95150.1 catechol 2,3-dioxygenase-like lactoylglutathione lyase family enzyme [Streptomonospora nanhaiensis]